MKSMLVSVAVVCCLGAGAVAAGTPGGMGKAGFEAAKAKIEAQAKADHKTCTRVKREIRDVCEAEAKGREKAEMAKLEARYKPSPDKTQDAKNAIAEANYDVAREKCDAMKGSAKKTCIKEAKAGREAAIRQARVEKVDSTGGMFGHGAAGERKPVKPGHS